MVLPVQVTGLFFDAMNDDVEMESHVRFMEAALALADAGAELGEVPVGAVVVKQGRIVASAHNRREMDADPAGHAELIAMREAARALGDWRLEGCTVYVTLEPCAMCAGLMVLSRIDACVYGCTDPKVGFLGTLTDLSAHPGLNHQFDVVSGVLADACSQRLKDFFRALRQRR